MTLDSSQWRESSTRESGTRQTLKVEDEERGFSWIPAGEFCMGLARIIKGASERRDVSSCEVDKGLLDVGDGSYAANPWGFSTCTATSGSGVWIITTTILREQQPIVRDSTPLVSQRELERRLGRRSSSAERFPLLSDF